MELRHLRYFVAVAEDLHFGHAAKRLHIAQPPLSQQIRGLESELGVLLLTRTNRRVQLTDAGRVFLDEARRTLAHVERAVDLARRATSSTIAHLSVAFVPWADYTSFPAAMRRFSDAHPQVTLELSCMSTPEQRVALRSRSVHVGVVRPALVEPSLRVERMLSEPLVALLPAGHPLCRHASIRLVDLAPEPFVSVPRHRVPEYWDVVLAATRKAGCTLTIRYEAPDPHSVLGLVAEGVGVSIAPAGVAAASSAGIEYRPLEPSDPRLDLAVAWREEEETSPVVQDLVKMLLDIVPRMPAAKTCSDGAGRPFTVRPGRKRTR